MFCKYCGKELSDNAAFCAFCGRPLKIATEETAVSEEITDISEESVHEMTAAEEMPDVTPEAAQAVQKKEEAPEISADSVPEAEMTPSQAEEAIVPEISASDPDNRKWVEIEQEGAEAADQGYAEPVIEPAAQDSASAEAYTAMQGATAGFTPGEGAAYAARQTAAAPPKKKKWWIWLIVAGGALVVIAAVIAVIFILKTKNAYNEAQDYYAAGKYEQAALAFDELGDYSNSADLAQRSRIWMEAQEQESIAGDNPYFWEMAADTYASLGSEGAEDEARCRSTAKYYDAQEYLESSDGDASIVEEAKALFEESGVLDYQAKVEECDNELLYIRAGELEEAHQLEEAKAIYDQLAAKNYKDADEKAEMCAAMKALSEGLELSDNGKWAEAYAAIEPFTEKGYDIVDNFAHECEDWITYQEAADLFAAGHFYDAYIKFGEIDNQYDGMADLYECMNACIQPIPGNGETYHNPNYTNNSVELTIDNTGFKNSFVKLYMGEELISCIFIAEDASATVWLPAGTYSMNKGYGDNWFGPDDMFGDEGRYWKCTFGDSETFTLEAYNGYLISSGGEGTSIYDDETDRDSM